MSAANESAPRNQKRGRKPRLGQQPRDRIYEAALACFERDGFNRASMDEVAEAAGISRPSLYYYFKSKDELVLEVVAREAANGLKDAQRRLTSSDPLERIAEAAFQGIIARWDHFVLAGDNAAVTERHMVSDRIVGLQREFWRPLLEQARTAGQLRLDRSIEDLIEWITFVQFSLGLHQETRHLSREQMRERINCYLVRSLLP